MKLGLKVEASLTPQEMERTMGFIIEQQAHFAVHIDKLLESVEKLERSQERLERSQERLQQTDERLHET